MHDVNLTLTFEVILILISCARYKSTVGVPGLYNHLIHPMTPRTKTCYMYYQNSLFEARG